MIEIKQLYKSYGELEVLKDINLTVNTGEIYGLVGRSEHEIYVVKMYKWFEELSKWKPEN